MYHVVDLLRVYLGLETWTLAHRAGVTLQELADVLYGGVVGGIEKFQKLAAYFGLPVDLLVRNDYRAVPESFFDTHPPLPDSYHPVAPQVEIGNKGEQLILEMERARVAQQFSGLSHLVMKIDGRPLDVNGFDVLSFDDLGRPMAIEIKSSADNTIQCIFTAAELEFARSFTEAGYRYRIVLISNLGNARQAIQSYDFAEYAQNHTFRPLSYVYKQVITWPVRGLQYHRIQAGLTQRQLAQRIGKCWDQIFRYERGRNQPLAEYYLRASRLLGVSVDDLLQWYDVRTGEVVAPPSMQKGEGNYASEGVERIRDLSPAVDACCPAAQPA